MYGSIFRMQVKPGQEQSVIDAFDQWDKERQPHVKGAIGGLLMKPDREARRADRRRRVRGQGLLQGQRRRPRAGRVVPTGQGATRVGP